MSEAVGAAATAQVSDPKATTPNDPRQAPAGQGTSASDAVNQNSIKEAAAEAKARNLKRLTLKVDGQEIVEEIDLDNDEELVKKLQKGIGAEKKMSQAARLRKQSEEFLNLMRDEDKVLEVLEKLGHKPRQFLEKKLSQYLEEETMDPRERELRDAKKKLQYYEELETRQKQEVERRRDEDLKKKFADDYNKQFTEALRDSNLPPTKAMVAEMAKYIHRAAKMNFQMTAKEAAQLVKEDIEAAHKNLYGEADAETLVRLLGENSLKKIREYDVSKLRDPNENLRTPAEQPETTRRAKDSGHRMTPQEWRMFNRK